MSERAHGMGARIVDRGYQHYDGKRLGTAHSVRMMVRGAMRRGMGVRRPTRAKILPWLLVLAAFAPTLFIIAFRIAIPSLSRLPLPSYGLLTTQVAAIFMLFAGLVAPDLLCADRRERVLSLYFSAPITRLHYIAAQVGGLILLLLLLSLGPLLLLFIGNMLLASSAPIYLRDHLDDLWHVLVSGGLLALYYAAVASAVASFTDRRAYASGTFLAIILVTGIVASVLERVSHFNGKEWLALIDLQYLPLRVARPLLGTPASPDLNVWACAGVTAGVILVSLGLVAWRYREVDD